MRFLKNRNTIEVALWVLVIGAVLTFAYEYYRP